MAGNNLFRQETFQQISSPDNLDEIMVVTSARSWILLATATFLLASTLAYGFLGRIPNLIPGQGMLLQGGEIVPIQHDVQGIVTEIHVKTGQQVEEKDLLLTVHRPDLENRVSEAQLQLHLAKTQNETLLAMETQQQEEQEKDHNAQMVSYQELETLTDKNFQNDQQTLATQKKMFEQELITKTEVLAAEEKVAATRGQLVHFKEQITQLKQSLFDLKNQLQVKQLQRHENIQKLELSLEQARARLDYGSRVHSPFAGRILETEILVGSQVSPASILFKLERGVQPSKPFVGSFYVGAEEVKKLIPGIRVQVFPGGVDSNIHGYLVGKVVEVSEIPVSRQTVENVLGEETLAQQVIQKLGAPYQVHLDFEFDPSTTSGYRWSSRKGPPIRLQSGTLCQAKFEVDSKRPISLVLSWVRQLLGSPDGE
ncbi:MAG: NHLP bacteriocin system secretion protein [Planctomycetota bacterium]|nr:NHLP bacteriocin system secretion protein [Planctomycetota bacterium]